MASTLNVLTSIKAYNNLATTFKTAISDAMEVADDSMERVQTQKDELLVRKGIYTDMKTNLDGLQTALKALISTQADYAVKATAKSTVVPGLSGSTVLSAATTDTTPFGDYDISVTQLAKAQSKASAAVASTDAALSKTGTFWLGGNGIPSAALATPSDTLASISTSVVGDGRRELGSGTYFVEVRDSGGVKQFRVVDADGNAVAINNATGSSTTSDWQAMSSGAFNTGRGFTLQLNAQGNQGATSLEYTARGTTIAITSTSTLKSIALAINSAAQPEGRDFTASIVGKQLVLTAAHTGANHGMLYTDGAGLGFGADLQPAQNAEFTINGLSISRASNTGLKDVVDGATINLASDAEGKTARLSVSKDYTKSTNAVNTLIEKFNASFKYLTDKMAVTSKAEGDKTTYTRGALAGDSVFRSLRFELMDRMNRGYTNTGAFKYLSQIGIEFNDNLQLKVDKTKLEEALKNNPADVTALLDAAMGNVEKVVSSYTGSTGALANTMKSMEDQEKSYDRRISSYVDSLNMRQQALIDQYSQMQTLLAELGSQAEMFGIDLDG